MAFVAPGHHGTVWNEYDVTWTEILLIRHGQTDSNRLRIIQGQNMVPLSVQGEKEASLVAKRLSSQFRRSKPAALVSSDLQRAFQTASAIGTAIGSEVQLDKRLREIHMGQWQDFSVADLISENEHAKETYPTWSRFSDAAFRYGIDGETLSEVQKRVVECVDEHVERHQGQTVVFVAHGISLRMYLAHALGIDAGHIFDKTEWSNTAIARVLVPSDRSKCPIRVVSTNDKAHLEDFFSIAPLSSPAPSAVSEAEKAEINKQEALNSQDGLSGAP